MLFKNGFTSYMIYRDCGRILRHPTFQAFQLNSKSLRASCNVDLLQDIVLGEIGIIGHRSLASAPVSGSSEVGESLMSGELAVQL